MSLADKASLSVDRDGKITVASESALELLGCRSAEDALGKSLADLGFSQTLWSHISPALRALGNLPPLRTFIRSRKGGTTTVRVSATPDDAGGAEILVEPENSDANPSEPQGNDASLAEAWEWKRAFQFAARYAHIGLAINTFNADNRARLVFLNQTGCDLLGISSPPAAGGDPFPADNLLRALQDRGEMVFRVGQDRWFNAGAAAGHYWGRNAMYVVFTDVTEQRDRLAAMDGARRRLQKARSELEHALAAMGGASSLPRQVRELMEAAAGAEQMLGDHRANDQEKPKTPAASRS